MKKSFLLLLIAGLAINMSCRKMNKSTSTTSSSTIYRGVVLKSMCTQTVIQTIGTDLIGQIGWHDGTLSPSPVYDHVFKVQDGCQVGVSSGDTINFKVISPQPQNCMACMVYISCPDTLVPIQVVP